jgi:dolichol-phosphate mannosyltransferase
VSGVRAARSEWIVTLDGDGQNDPADIPILLRPLDGAPANTAMVNGWRRQRRDPWLKRWASRVANAAYRVARGDHTPDVSCGMKLFRRRLFLDLPRFDAMHRFLPAVVRMHGGEVLAAEVRHRERRSGRSKYGTIGDIRAASTPP